jgi:hypothetical protein
MKWNALWLAAVAVLAGSRLGPQDIGECVAPAVLDLVWLDMSHPLGYKPIARATCPAMKRITAVAISVRSEMAMCAHRLSNRPVRGHAAIPERSANHPLVGRMGPLVAISHIPPPPATRVQVQAKAQLSNAPTVRGVASVFRSRR